MKFDFATTLVVVVVVVVVVMAAAVIISKTLPVSEHYATSTCSKSGGEASPILTSIFRGGGEISFKFS
jgi:hypothetical protein